MFITFEINEVEPRKLWNECHVIYLHIPIYDEKYPCCNIPVLCRVEMSLKGTSEVWVTNFKTFLFFGISFYRQRIGLSLWCDWFVIVLVWKPMNKKAVLHLKCQTELSRNLKTNSLCVFLALIIFFTSMPLAKYDENSNFPLAIL